VFGLVCAIIGLEPGRIAWILGCFTLLGPLLAVGPVAQMIERITLRKKGAVELGISYSNEGIEIDDGKSTKRRSWQDYAEWFEKEGLLLLYRRKKFFPEMGYIFDPIDLNQISEEERASFMEIVRAKIAKAT
jgi:hypothetical protein